MKVIVAVVVILIVSGVSAQAPYPPSGYRPPGRQFVLPTRPTDNSGFGSGIQPQNQYVPPTTEYGPPDNTEAPPPSQYLPALQPSDFRFNTGQQNVGAFSNQNQQDSSFNQQTRGTQLPQQHYGAPYQYERRPTNNRKQNQGGFSSQQDFSSQSEQDDSYNQQSSGQQLHQQQYGTPAQNQIRQQNRGESSNANSYNQQTTPQQQQYSARTQTQNQDSLQFSQNRQEYYRQQQNYSKQIKNVEQEAFVGQRVADQNQGFGNRQRPSASERNYLAPQSKQSRKQSARQRLYQEPQSIDNESANNQNDDQDFSGNDERNFGVSNENYLPPTTTERRGYPEPTTRRPNIRDEPEPEDNESDDPNVAIATAVAKGQYYLWQPDGRLQRVLYKTTQTREEVKNNEYSAKLVYQPVQPITAPIFSYSAPLVRLA